MLGFLQQLLEWLRSFFFKREMELAMIGLNKAGKSTLVDVLAHGTFSEDLQPTVGFNMRKITKGRVNIKLWDVGGQERFRSMWERYCRGVNAIVYVVDAADQSKIQESAQLLHDLMGRPSLQNVPLLVLGNKNDLPEALTERSLRGQMRLDDLQCDVYAVYSISCKRQTNIDVVLDWLIKHSKS